MDPEFVFHCIGAISLALSVVFQKRDRLQV